MRRGNISPMLLAQRFALAVNGILARLNSDDFYVLGGNEPPEEWAGMARGGLAVDSP